MMEQSSTTNLEYYRVFYYVVQYGNISLAASKLSLSQPSARDVLQTQFAALPSYVLQFY